MTNNRNEKRDLLHCNVKSTDMQRLQAFLNLQAKMQSIWFMQISGVFSDPEANIQTKRWNAQTSIFRHFLIWGCPLIQTSAQLHADGNEYKRSAIQNFEPTFYIGKVSNHACSDLSD